VIESWLRVEESKFIRDPGGEQGIQPLSPRSFLCEKGQVDPKTLDRILSRERATVPFNIADRLISTACHMPQAWLSPPLDIYYYGPEGPPPDKSKPVKCERRNCNNWFELELIPHEMFLGGRDKAHGRKTPRGPQDGVRFTTRRFCSENCATMEGRYRRGQTVPKSETHFRCGHEKSPENTQRAGNYLRCRECNRAACAAAYKKRKAAA
jgi:hypothetical protein